MIGGGERERTALRETAVREMVDRVAATYAVTSIVTDSELGGGGGASPRERVVHPSAWAAEGGQDLVVSFDAPGRRKDWAEYLLLLGGHARKALLVFARNAERAGQGESPDTVALAQVLWQVGRVREHAYLGVPRLLGLSHAVQAPAGVLVRKTARMHAFVVDTTPRTPQARRRLRAVDDSPHQDPGGDA